MLHTCTHPACPRPSQSALLKNLWMPTALGLSLLLSALCVLYVARRLRRSALV